MGFLSETKIKRKLQHDPNNTKWTRNENTFGQKILRSHGWQPGQYLGVQDAPHSELHTAANASYIRVAMKDDMKGLGFDKAMKDDEITGLDVFTDLLSRLNGKSEEAVQEEKKARLVVKTHRFVEQRYGAMRFVRGGLLVGDELKADANEPKANSEEEEEKTLSKKRKATSLEEAEDDTPSVTEPESKKKRKKEEKKSSKKRSAEVSSDDTPSTETDSKAKRKEKKSKKDKKDKSAKETEEEDADVETPAAAKESASTDQIDDSEVSKPKKSKEERKEEKRLKKLRKEEKREAKRRKKAEAKASSKSTSPEPSSTEDATTTTDATPAGSGTSTPKANPHFVRSRFLKAKREAILDSNAINKIFMMKA